MLVEKKERKKGLVSNMIAAGESLASL